MLGAPAERVCEPEPCWTPSMPTGVSLEPRPREVERARGAAADDVAAEDAASTGLADEMTGWSVLLPGADDIEDWLVFEVLNMLGFVASHL